MKEQNIAFIDGQNLHLGIMSEGWKIDMSRFGVFIHDRFSVEEAYYFLGCIDDNQTELYSNIQKAGFILIFREHSSVMMGAKKGNVDTDIVFVIMKRLYRKEDFKKIILVSGDGDYFKMVKFLIEENRLDRLIFPNKRYSSLYRNLDAKYRFNISLPDIRSKLEYKKKGAS